MSRFCMSARTALGDARVLDLDGHLAAVLGERRAVDLPDRGRRDRLLVEAREDLRDRLFEVLLDHPAHLLEGDRRRGVAQLGQLALELLAVLLGDEPDVEEGHHLPELHRRALHRPEHRDDLLGGLELAPRHRLLGGLLVARDVGGARAELLDGLARGERGDGRRAAHARGRDLLVLARHDLHARSARVAGGGPSPAAQPPRSTREPGTMSSDAVRPAHPGLRAAVVVGAEQDERRGLAERRARLGALGVETAPDADEGVRVPLARRRSCRRRGPGG